MEDDGRSVDGIYYLDFWDGDGSRSGVERAAEGSRGQQMAAENNRRRSGLSQLWHSSSPGRVTLPVVARSSSSSVVVGTRQMILFGNLGTVPTNHWHSWPHVTGVSGGDLGSFYGI